MNRIGTSLDTSLDAGAARSTGRKSRAGPLPRLLVAGYAVFWTLLAIAPRHRSDWLLENLLVFAFAGLLLFLPVREVVAKLARVDAPWRSPFTVASVAFFSSFYEVIEWIAAKIVSPDTALAYLGTQGDVFDAQKDMVLALAGAATALVVGSCARRWRRRRRSTV